MMVAEGGSVHLSMENREEFAGTSILLAVSVQTVCGIVKQLVFSFPHQSHVAVKLYDFPSSIKLLFLGICVCRFGCVAGGPMPYGEVR